MVKILKKILEESIKKDPIEIKEKVISELFTRANKKIDEKKNAE